jgi:hypothetical protein
VSSNALEAALCNALAEVGGRHNTNLFFGPTLGSLLELRPSKQDKQARDDVLPVPVFSVLVIDFVCPKFKHRKHFVECDRH